MNDNSGGRPPSSGFLVEAWAPEVRAGLEAMVVANPGGLAAFDFDNTILEGDLSETILEELDRADSRDLIAEYEAHCAANTRDGYAKLVETLLVGKTELEVRAHTRAILDAHLAKGTLRLRPAFMELIWFMQRYDWEVWVVTASPAVVIGVAAQRVGIPASRVLGMWCEPGPDGHFMAPTREPITYRQGKVEALLGATEGRAPTFAAGDALTDLELLHSAQYALVLDRGNAILRSEAAANSWWLQENL